MGKKINIFSTWPLELRAQVAIFIRECRKRDRGEATLEVPWLSQTRNLDEYCNRLEVSKDFIEAFLESRIHQQGEASVLDVGVGKGGALQNLHSRFGDSIHLEGIGLSFASFKLENYQHRVGLIEALPLPENYFDLIFSVRGGFAYTLHSFAALENVLNSLRKGGMAFLEDSRLLLTQEWFRDYLKNHHFEVEETRYQEGLPVAFKLIKLSDQKMDFHLLSERYASLINGHEKIFQQWGFDRIRKDSPLNALFQELYSLAHYKDLIIS